MQVLLYADAVERAGTFYPPEVIKALEGYEFDGLGNGPTLYRADDHQCFKDVYVVKGKDAAGVFFHETVGHRPMRPIPLSCGERRDRQTGTQPQPQHDVLDVPGGVVQFLEIRHRQPATGQRLGISVGVLDIPPPPGPDEPVRARPGAPPLTTDPVTQVVPGFDAGTVPV